MPSACNALEKSINGSRHCGGMRLHQWDHSAFEREETALGYMSIAVPLFTGETTAVGALSITAPTYRADANRYLKALQTVRQQMTAVGALI